MALARLAALSAAALGAAGDAPADPLAPLPVAALATQGDARIPQGGAVRFYVVGSSNAAWQTWPDQLHAMLQRLGYTTNLPATDIPGEITGPYGRTVPLCDDAASYEALSTPRLGMQGWSSWGFAYESDADCDASGFRDIADWRVSCTNGWACKEKWRGNVPIVPVSALARGVQGADVVVLANFVNDARNALYCPHDCYGNASVPDALNTTAITAANVLRTIRAIHAQDPAVTVLVLARYADAKQVLYVNNRTLARVEAINAAVRASIQDEPNTYWVDSAFPEGVSMFQTLNGGHANCRGDKVMASNVIDAMFRHRVLARGLELGDASCLARTDCAGLALPCCQRAAACYVDGSGTCAPYGAGRQ